jgi:hypothetical protein
MKLIWGATIGFIWGIASVLAVLANPAFNILDKIIFLPAFLSQIVILLLLNATVSALLFYAFIFLPLIFGLLIGAFIGYSLDFYGV